MLPLSCPRRRLRSSPHMHSPSLFAPAALTSVLAALAVASASVPAALPWLPFRVPAALASVLAALAIASVLRPDLVVLQTLVNCLQVSLPLPPLIGCALSPNQSLTAFRCLLTRVN